MRIFLVILAALIVAGGTGFYVMQGLQPAAPEAVAQAAAPAPIEVYVPATEIAVGTIITPERLSRMQVAEGSITAEMIVADADGASYLTGSVARQVLPQGVPIARSAIVQPGDRGFLAAVLPRGKRRDHHSRRRDRQPERPGAPRRPRRPHPHLCGHRRRRGRRHHPRQRNRHAQPPRPRLRPAPRSRQAGRRRTARRKPLPSPRPRPSRSPPRRPRWSPSPRPSARSRWC